MDIMTDTLLGVEAAVMGILDMAMALTLAVTGMDIRMDMDPPVRVMVTDIRQVDGVGVVVAAAVANQQVYLTCCYWGNTEVAIPPLVYTLHLAVRLCSCVLYLHALPVMQPRLRARWTGRGTGQPGAVGGAERRSTIEAVGHRVSGKRQYDSANTRHGTLHQACQDTSRGEKAVWAVCLWRNR